MFVLDFLKSLSVQTLQVALAATVALLFCCILALIKGFLAGRKRQAAHIALIEDLARAKGMLEAEQGNKKFIEKQLQLWMDEIRLIMGKSK